MERKIPPWIPQGLARILFGLCKSKLLSIPHQETCLRISVTVKGNTTVHPALERGQTVPPHRRTLQGPTPSSLKKGQLEGAHSHIWPRQIPPPTAIFHPDSTMTHTRCHSDAPVTLDIVFITKSAYVTLKSLSLSGLCTLSGTRSGTESGTGSAHSFQAHGGVRMLHQPPQLYNSSLPVWESLLGVSTAPGETGVHSRSGEKA